MALIGYARVSTEDQATFSQLDELRAAGCAEIFEEKASGASRARPELAKAMLRIGRACAGAGHRSRTYWTAPRSRGKARRSTVYREMSLAGV